MKIKNDYLKAIIIRIMIISVGLIESIIFARYFGSTIKGQISYINSISQILFLVCTFGIYSVYPFYKKNKDKYILSKLMTINIIFFIVYSTISLILYFNINDILLKFIIIINPILCYNYIIMYIYAVDEPNSKNLLLLLIYIIKILYLIILTIFIKKSLVLGVSTIIFIPFIENIILTKKIKFNFDIKYIKELIKYIKIGWVPLLVTILTILNYKLDIIMLKNNNISLSLIGIYAVGIGLSEKIYIFSDAIKEILLSKLSNGENDNNVAKVIRYCFTITFILAILVAIISKYLINILYGNEYVEAYKITNITIIGSVFMIYFKLITQYNTVNNNQKYNLLFLIVGVLINYLLNNLLIPIYGMYGAGISTMLGYLISAILFIIYFHKTTKIPYNKLFFINKDDMKGLKL